LTDRDNVAKALEVVVGDGVYYGNDGGPKK